MVWALPQLDILVMVLIALGVCLLVYAFTKAFFGVTGSLVGKLPIVGGWLEASAHRIGQRIANVFGGFAGKLEAIVGASWHSMARTVDRIGHELAAHAGLLATIAQFVPGVSTLTTLYRLVRQAGTLAAHLAHELVGIGNDLGHRIRGVERGIGNDVLPRIRSLDKRLDRVVNHDIAGLRAGEKATARDLGRLRDYVRSHPWTAVTATFVGAVAVALSRLGLDWIKCPTAKSVFNKRGCNMWSGLEKVLGLLADVLLVTNICRVLPWLEDAFSVVAAPLIATLTTAGAGLCEPGSSAPELLPDVALYLPASQGAALYLS